MRNFLILFFIVFCVFFMALDNNGETSVVRIENKEDRTTSERYLYQMIIVRVAKKHNIKPAHLLKMAEIESGFNPAAVGDGGRSIGMFQIQYRLHNVRIVDAFDVEKSAEWACRFLNLKGYQKNPRKAVQRYNGVGKRARAYADKVMRE